MTGSTSNSTPAFIKMPGKFGLTFYEYINSILSESFPTQLTNFLIKGLEHHLVLHQWMKRDDEDHMRKIEKRARAALE